MVTRRLSTFNGRHAELPLHSLHTVSMSTQYPHNIYSGWRGDHDKWWDYRLRLDIFLSPGTRGHGVDSEHWTLDTGHIVNTRHHWPTFPACGSPPPPPIFPISRSLCDGWCELRQWGDKFLAPFQFVIIIALHQPPCVFTLQLVSDGLMKSQHPRSHINNLPALDVARAKTEQQQETRREAWGVNKLGY